MHVVVSKIWSGQRPKTGTIQEICSCFTEHIAKFVPGSTNAYPKKYRYVSSESSILYFYGAEIYCVNLIVLSSDHLNPWHQKRSMIEFNSNFINYYISQWIKGSNPTISSRCLAKEHRRCNSETSKISFNPLRFGESV